jgi:hypothetical protein
MKIRAFVLTRFAKEVVMLSDEEKISLRIKANLCSPMKDIVAFILSGGRLWTT